MSRFIHYYAECPYAECHYAECRNAKCHMPIVKFWQSEQKTVDLGS